MTRPPAVSFGSSAASQTSGSTMRPPPPSVHSLFRPDQLSNVGTFDFDVEFESACCDNVPVPVQFALTRTLLLELMDAGDLTFRTRDTQTTHFRVPASHMSTLFGETLCVRADVAEPNVGVVGSRCVDGLGLSEPCVRSDVGYVCRPARNDSSPVRNTPTPIYRWTSTWTGCPSP